MAWWDAQHTTLGASPRSKSRLVMGDAFPRLGPAHVDKQFEMDRERALLSPVFEEQLGPPTTPALVVHVDIRFTDPVIRSRYCRSYGSSPDFEATNRICRGLVRRIERCCEEFVTRKDSAALEMFKGDTYERKPQRFEMKFRIMRRGKGEWAERTYRSYQKQPLTVAFTKEVILATHRIIGLFLRRHDGRFQWLDCPSPETDLDESQTLVPSHASLVSLLSVPRTRFIEATQTFEFVPGYTIELSFRTTNPQRQVPLFEKRIEVNSTQSAPLTLFLSEDVLWKGLQFINRGLDLKKREFDDHLENHRNLYLPHTDDDTLEIDLRVSNNLGPAFSHTQKSIRSKLALFRDQDAKDCDLFLCDIEKHLGHVRDEADSTLNAMNDLEFRIVELKGVGWTLREPAKFTVGPSASHDRRTIQAALDRIQTGIGDVIRGHNIAIHIKAHKRGHLVLDKAIVAHEKHGKPKETFASREDAQAVLIARLKARIQKDIDRVFEDSCCIDDIPEDEEDYFAARPVTPAMPEQAVFEEFSPRYSPSSIRSSPAKQSRSFLSSIPSSPRPRTQRVFSLSRRSTESMRSIDYLKAASNSPAIDGSRPSTAASGQAPEPRLTESPLLEPLGPLLAPAEVRPARSSSLVSRGSSSAIRVSNASTLVEEQAVTDSEAKSGSPDHKEAGVVQQRSEESRASEAMTSKEGEVSPVAAPAGSLPGEAALGASSAPCPAVGHREAPSRNRDALNAPSPVRKAKRGKMDSPEVFEDAREYAISPVPEGKANPEALDALARTASPRQADEFSTAPSTPELSTGNSSPRHSTLVTPVYLRSDSGTKQSVPRDFYPASGPERPAINPQGETPAEPAIDKDDRDCAAAREPQVEQHTSPSPLPQADTEQSTTAHENPDDDHGDGDANTAQPPNPTSRAVSPDNETSDAVKPTTTITTTSDVSPSSSSESNKVNDQATSASEIASEINCHHFPAAHLGPEPADGSDNIPVNAPPPDFPTPQVRTSHDPPGGEESAAHSSPAVVSSGADTAKNAGSGFDALGLLSPAVPEPEPEPEPSYVISDAGAAGGELGAGDGAEGRYVEDSGGKDGPDDVSSDAVSGEREDVESAAGEGSAGVVAEGVEEGTEGSVETPLVVEDVERVQREDAGSEAGRYVGDEGGGDGSGVVADEEKEELLAAEDGGSGNVGPAEEAEVVDDTGGRALASPEEGPEQSDGTDSGTEVQAEPEVVGHDGDDTSMKPSKAPEERLKEDHGPDLETEASLFNSKNRLREVHGSGSGTEAGHLDPEDRPDENHGPGSGAEGAHLVTEDDASSKGRDVANAERPVNVPSDAAEGRISSPSAFLELTEPSVSVPEQQADVKGPELSITDGTEQGVHLRAEGISPDDGAEPQGNTTEDDGIGADHQDVVPELRAATSEAENEEAPDAAPAPAEDAEAGNLEAGMVDAVMEEPNVASAPAETVKPGKPGQDTVDQTKEEPDAAPAVSDVAEGEDVGDGLTQSDQKETPSAPGLANSVDAAETDTSKPDIHEAAQEAASEATVAVETGSPEGSFGEVEKQLVPVPNATGAEPPGIRLENGGMKGSDILSALADVAEAEVSEKFGLATPGPAETEPSKAGVNEAIVEQANEMTGKPDGTETKPETAASVDATKVAGRHDSGISLGDIVSEIRATETDAPESETGEEQLVQDDGLSREPAHVAEEEVRPSGPQVQDHDLPQELDVGTGGGGGDEASEPHKEAEPHHDAVAANDNAILSEVLRPEIGNGETGETLDEESNKPNVGVEPEALEPQSHDKHVTPAITSDELTSSAPTTSATAPETAEPNLPSGHPAQSATALTAEITLQNSISSPPPHPEKPKPHLAPIPDLSKLSNLFPTPSRTSLSSDASSFLSLPRNSVDTIRPSTDERQRPAVPLFDSPHVTSTSTSRPQTAGYLGLHLGFYEPRFVEVGLRGALGDVKARRLSLPLQRLWDKEAVNHPSAPASEAGGSRSSKSRLRGLRGGSEKKSKEQEAADDPSVLPRMMVLLAGAVAVAKIMRRAAE